MIKSPGIQYSTVPGCARSFFRCAPYQATISTDACAGRFGVAQTARDEALEAVLHCRTCIVGAAHSGRTVTRFAALYGSLICPRCGKGTTRMIGGRRCVSCYNREREVRAGRDARGNPPIGLRAPRGVTIQAVIDGAPRIIAGHVVDTTELVAHVLRTTAGRIAFTTRRNSPMRQGRLF